LLWFCTAEGFSCHALPSLARRPPPSLNGGTAKFSTAKLTVGDHGIVAAYSGDPKFAASNSPALHQVVDQATTTTMLVSSLNPPAGGLPVTFTASVVPQYSGTPSGTVTFKNGTTIMGKVYVTRIRPT
jgi:hypothetical protein